MFLVHPIFQSVGILMAVYVWWLGFQRFKMLHLNQKIRFNWKQHVRFGIMATVSWLIGISGGLYMIKSSWHGMLITGIHSKIGVLIIPFILFSVGTGLYMDQKKKKRKVLPLIHGINNTVMLLLALSQIYTGIIVYQEFVLGL